VIIGYGLKVMPTPLKDSGMNVIVGLYPGKSYSKAEAAGLLFTSVADAAPGGDSTDSSR